MDASPDSSRKPFIVWVDLPTLLVALPIQVAFLVFLFGGGLKGFSSDPSSPEMMAFPIFLFHLLPGVLVLGLLHGIFPVAEQALSLPVIIAGSIAVSVLYARALCELFGPFFRPAKSPALKLMRMMPGLMSLGLAIYFGAAVYHVNRPTKERNAIRDIRGLENLMGFYQLTHQPRPEGDAASQFQTLLTVNRGHHGPRLRIEAERLGSDGIYRDPWGNPYVFGWGTRPWAYSLGPNGLDEGGRGDDISDWNRK